MHLAKVFSEFTAKCFQTEEPLPLKWHQSENLLIHIILNELMGIFKVSPVVASAGLVSEDERTVVALHQGFSLVNQVVVPHCRLVRTLDEHIVTI